MTARLRAIVPLLPLLPEAIDWARPHAASQAFLRQPCARLAAISGLDADAAGSSLLANATRLRAVCPLVPLSPLAVHWAWLRATRQHLLRLATAHAATVLVDLLATSRPLLPTASTGSSALRKPCPQVPLAIQWARIHITADVRRVIANAFFSAMCGHGQAGSLSDSQSATTCLLANAPAVPHLPFAVDWTTLSAARRLLSRRPVANLATVLRHLLVNASPFSEPSAARLCAIGPFVPQVPYAIERARLDVAHLSFCRCLVAGNTAELLQNLVSLPHFHATTTRQSAHGPISPRLPSAILRAWEDVARPGLRRNSTTVLATILWLHHDHAVPHVDAAAA